MKHTPLIATLITIATLGSTAAQTVIIDTRQHRQEHRIQQGVNSRALTRGEANALERGQNRIQRMENRVTMDGVVTNRERARLNAAQNHQSRKIYRLKHNGRGY